MSFAAFGCAVILAAKYPFFLLYTPCALDERAWIQKKTKTNPETDRNFQPCHGPLASENFGRFKNLWLNPRHYNFRLRVLCAEAGEQLEKDVKAPPTRSQNNRCVFMTWIISLFCGTTLQDPAPIGRPSPPPRQWQGK